ncbi:MAG: hypothetical protein SCARUB_02839, partial [Candidatus Scalindua rubra]
MKYKVLFPTRSIATKFAKTLSKIPQVQLQKKLLKTVESLAT